MKSVPQISDAEWKVMKVIWAKSPITANQVVERLADEESWQPKTIKTLLNRLVKKKAIGYEPNGREYHYHPLVGECECVNLESRSFLKRVYGGAVKPMLAALIESERLSAEDIKELKQILDRKGRG